MLCDWVSCRSDIFLFLLPLACRLLPLSALSSSADNANIAPEFSPVILPFLASNSSRIFACRSFGFGIVSRDSMAHLKISNDGGRVSNSMNPSWSELITISMSPSLSTISKNSLRCSRRSPSSAILWFESCLQSAALLAGPFDSKILSSFNHISLEEVQFFTCFSSEREMAKIMSDFAFRSFLFHSVMAAALALSAAGSGLIFTPST